MMSVEVKPGSQFDASVPRLLFETQGQFGFLQAVHTGEHYAVSADGKRFLFPELKEEPGSASITVVQNWLAGLKK